MNTNEISGKRQMEFLAEFDYIREAGTTGEEKAAKIIQETLNSLVWRIIWKSLALKLFR